MRLLAERYKATTNSNYKTAFKNAFGKALNFLFTMQRSSGGFPQVWPERGNYSDYITFNDNAMVRVLVLLKDIADGVAPFDSDIIASSDKEKAKTSVDKAVDFILKSQIVNGSTLTVWCAQHDANNYKPLGARAYELPSKSGSESAGIVWFLMNLPDQTEAIQNSIKSAIAWYKKTRVVGLYFNKNSGTFDVRDGNVLWYRFYEVNSDDYFFCDREGESTKTQDFTRISEERRTGYQWAGDYGTALINTESAYLAALEEIGDVQTPVVPSTPEVKEMLCGEVVCKTTLDGYDFIEAKGVTEASNAGFIGKGYANVDNEVGSFVTYGITAKEAGMYTIFIRYANGGNSDRSGVLKRGENTLVSALSMWTTGAWTTWDIMEIEVQLPEGYSEISFVSTSNDGLANIDELGWMHDDLYVGKVDIHSDKLRSQPKKSQMQFARKTLWVKSANAFNVKVFNVQGELVQQKTNVINNVNFNELKAGYYLFEVEFNGKKEHEIFKVK